MGLFIYQIIKIETKTSSSDDEKKCILSDMARNPMVAPGDDIPQPEDVAHLVIFLASDKAKFINGALIPLDGGFTCR